MQTNKYFWDENKVRYNLVTANAGPAYNWLFFPGGPGADSSYFLDLVNLLNLPGNTWLIDLPGNGSNVSENVSYNFDHWFDCLLPCLAKFQNPIYVGHSFGAMLPLLFPELENILKGFVILNSSPSLWIEEAAKLTVAKGLSIFVEPLEEFKNNPSPATFTKALMACMPYYFPEESISQGRLLFQSLPFNYLAATWWLHKATEINYNAKWIPQTVPTLIMGGSEDCMTPYSLFEKDQRFDRDNITRKLIHKAGHAPWLEKPTEVKAAFHDLLARVGE